LRSYFFALLQTSERNRLASSELQLEKLRAEVALFEVEKRDWKVTAQKAEELALEVERLETECDVKEAQKGELETRINEITCRLDQLRAESSTKITDLTEQLNSSTASAAAFEKDLKKTQSALASARIHVVVFAESEKRAVAEHEMGLMREQLLQNASLLASPHFSRAGSMRSENGRQPFSLSGPDGNSVSFGGSSSDLDEIALILRQQQMINDLRMRAEQYQRENERLRNVVEASSLVDSLEKRTSNLNRVLMDRNREIEKLEKRLLETTPAFVSSSPTYSTFTTDRTWWSSPPTPAPSECGTRPLADRLSEMCETVLFAAPSVIAMWLAYNKG
ncbi:hypothetical protein ANCDUO_13741, partial [Ancylostoma duodenale]